jgi:FAD/FMN-containing dehydrogenase
LINIFGRLFMAIKDQLKAIVGAANVLDSPEIIESYSKDHSLAKPGQFTCVVRPTDAHQVQKIIKLANAEKFAVVPRSSGIHFHGNAIPKMGGVVLDLSGMNSIKEIDEYDLTAHVEVGVTWDQLQPQLLAKGYRCTIPLLPHASRSVVIDWLEREQPVAQIHEYSEPMLSMQLIWGMGEEFVTGSASINHFRKAFCVEDGTTSAGPGPVSWERFIHGAQGTMGVVTWWIVQIQPLPTMTKTKFITTDRAEDAIEPIYKILRRRIGYECLLINNINLAAILAESWPAQFTNLRAILPPWTTILVIGGLKYRPDERIAYQEKTLDEIMGSYFPGLKAQDTLPGLPAVEKRIPEMLLRPWPKDKTYWKHAYKGGCVDLIFMTTLDWVERFIPAVNEVAARHQYPLNDIGCYIQPVENGHACQLEFNFYYNPQDEAETERMRSLYAEAAAAVFERGAWFSRPYGSAVTNMVYKKYGEYVTTVKRFKKYFDPNYIMNPGTLCF